MVKSKKTSKTVTGETSTKYSNVSLRGQSFVGVVVSSKSMKSATVEIKRKHYVPKYERYENRLTRLHVHNPPSINAKEGDIVKVSETRPLAKTIHHIIVEKVGEVATYKGQKMVEEEEKAKILSKKKEADKKEDTKPVKKAKKQEQFKEDEE